MKCTHSSKTFEIKINSIKYKGVAMKCTHSSEAFEFKIINVKYKGFDCPADQHIHLNPEII